jgi:hypothetical protein
MPDTGGGMSDFRIGGTPDVFLLTNACHFSRHIVSFRAVILFFYSFCSFGTQFEIL